MKNRLFIAAFLSFWLSGCTVISSPVPSTSLLPTASVTATLTRIAPIPTFTSSPAPDLSATEFAITSTAIVEAVVTAQPPRVYESYPSPDGRWLAEVVIYDCVRVDPRPDADSNAYEQLRIVEESTGNISGADSQLLNCGGLGAFGLEGLFWSINSRYFYYTDARQGVPDGCGGFWQRPILRLDINMLRSEDLGAGFLSPDGMKIAAWQRNELVIWDVHGGAEFGRISPIVLNTETGNGPIVWSPNSQGLVYIQTESYCPVSGNSSVVHVNASTLAQKLLIESETPTFGGASWENANELILSDENGDQWVYTFDTRALELLP